MIAVVTGGGKGIGRVIAETLALEGWDLWLVGRDLKALSDVALGLRERTRQRVRTIQIDLMDPQSATFVMATATKFGVVPDALICNAGDYGVLGELENVNFAAWRASFTLNFFVVAELVRLYLQAVRTEAQGRIKRILIVGGSGLGGPRVVPAMSAYACAKAALWRLVETVHEEMQENGNLAINMLAPGPAATGMTEQLAKNGLAGLSGHADHAFERGTETTFANVAASVRALFSPACEGVSGRLISATWDREELAHPETWSADRDRYRLRRVDDRLFERKR